MVQVTVRGRRQFQRAEANVVESLVIDTVRFVGVLDQLVNREGGVVGFDDGVRYLNRDKYINIETLRRARIRSSRVYLRLGRGANTRRKKRNTTGSSYSFLGIHDTIRK